MPAIHRLGNLTIYIYADDHLPPHFHVRGPDSSMQIDIATLQVIRGRYRPGDFAKAVRWAAEHRPLLLQTWSELNERS